MVKRRLINHVASGHTLLGFSKKARAQKELLAAFDVLLIGRKEDKTEILKNAKGQLPQLSENVMNGANPYETALKIIQAHILTLLMKSAKEERIEYLKRISDNNFRAQPHIFELISHINYCLMILEDETNPLISIGTAEKYLVAVCKWFGSSDKLLQRVIVYFADSTQNHRIKLQQTRKRNERAGRLS